MTEPANLASEPSSDQALLEAFGAPMARSAWRIQARNHARTLFDSVGEAEGGPTLEGTRTLTRAQTVQALLIRKGIARAVSAASFRPAGRERVLDWWSGAGIETAWSELHRADERLLLIQSLATVHDRMPDIAVALRNNLKEDDPRLTETTSRLEELAKAQWGPDVGVPAQATAVPAQAAGHPDLDGERLRVELRRCLGIANTASDEAHANVRSQRNLLIAIGLCLIVGLAVIAVLHALAHGFIDLSMPAAGPADAVEVWEAEAVGALGGLIAAVFTISKLGGFSGVYRLPVYQALIRVPAGAAVAVAAVVLVQSSLVNALGAQQGLGVLVVALIFGYAPDVLLRFMDQKATTLLGQAQSKDDPARPPLVHPRA